MLVLKKTSEILCGADKAVVRGVQFMRNVREKMDIFFDHIAPSRSLSPIADPTVITSTTGAHVLLLDRTIGQNIQCLM